MSTIAMRGEKMDREGMSIDGGLGIKPMQEHPFFCSPHLSYPSPLVTNDTTPHPLNLR